MESKLLNFNFVDKVPKAETQALENSMEIIEGIREDLSILRIHNFNMSLLSKYPYLEKYFDSENISLDYKRKELTNLLNKQKKERLFNTIYKIFRLLPHYSLTGVQGWSHSLQIAFSNFFQKTPSKELLVIDFSEGTRALTRKIHLLSSNSYITVIGMSHSMQIAYQARKNNQIVFCGNHKILPFKRESADIVAVSQEFPYTTPQQREKLIGDMKLLLKKEGLCIIQDFEEESTTAKWYREIIRSYGGDKSPSLQGTRKHLTQSLELYFKNIVTGYLYDPFYLEGEEGQDSYSLKCEFYASLIELYNLNKLLPKNISIKNLKGYKNVSYWENINKLLSPYFTLTKSEGKEVATPSLKKNVQGLIPKSTLPVVKKLTIFRYEDNKVVLVAPRVALVGIGCNVTL
jgi:hypothetical protein